ncbi:hypothetical protein EYV94_00450 [Puteibacter caeruleilacunae]|nr:hypothetical protein EYV94_00450 [Puteibacter caeruleilacunae]
MRKFRYILFILFAFTMTVGCEDMMDMHSEYVKNGETIYSVKVDSMIVYPGNGRMKLKGYLRNGMQVKNIKVKWEDVEKTEFVETIAYDYSASPDSFITTIDISEGQYLLELTSENADGNSSIATQFDAKVYGETYRSYLENRSIQKILPNVTGGAAITFGPAASNNVLVKLQYQTTEGVEKTVEVEPSQTNLVIADCDLHEPVQYSSGYLPAENAIDIFYCDAKELDLEYLTDIAFEFDKSSWEIIDFSTEELPANEGGGNGPAVNIIDGNNGSYWQSQWDGGTGQIPHHITIDMKNTFNVTKIDLYRRAGNNHTKRVVIEGSIDGVNWEEVSTLDYTDDGADQLEVLELSEGRRMRFIKLNVVESNAPPYVSLGEITVTGKL